MKIKIGQPGNQKEMLERTRRALKFTDFKAIDSAHQKRKTCLLPDANGGTKPGKLFRFLEYAEEIGASEQIAIIEGVLRN